MSPVWWQNLFEPPTITAVAGLLTAVAAVIAALKAHRTAKGAKRSAASTRVEAAKAVPALSARSDRNAALIDVLSQRIASLEDNFHALLEITARNGNGAPPSVPPPNPTGAAEQPGPTG